MYSIVNTSGRHLSFQDLRIVLSPRERIDLDTVCERREIESSIHLKHALQKGYVKVVVKDKDGFDAKNQISPTNQITKEDLDKIKNDLASIIKSALLNVNMSSSTEVKPQEKEESSVSFEMSQEILENIHKKAVERLMTNSDNSLEVKKSQSKSININKNLDELEGLL